MQYCAIYLFLPYCFTEYGKGQKWIGSYVYCCAKSSTIRITLLFLNNSYHYRCDNISEGVGKYASMCYSPKVSKIPWKCWYEYAFLLPLFHMYISNVILRVLIMENDKLLNYFARGIYQLSMDSVTKRRFYVLAQTTLSIPPEPVSKNMGQEMSAPDSSNGSNVRHESEGWEFESHSGRDISVSKTLTLSQKHLFVCHKWMLLPTHS